MATMLDHIERLLADPAIYKARLKEYRALVDDHDKKLDKLREEDARLEKLWQASEQNKREAYAALTDANKRAATNQSTENDLRQREIALRKVQSDWHEQVQVREAELRERENDIARRETALKPHEARLAARARELEHKAESLNERERRAVAFVRSMNA